MADADEQAKLRSYLAAQSAKLPAAEIRARAHGGGPRAPPAALLERLRRGQAAVSDVLAAQGGEPHTDLRVADGYFGEINWKGYALILRLHYRDHARQVARTLAAVEPPALTRRARRARRAGPSPPTSDSR